MSARGAASDAGVGVSSRDVARVFFAVDTSGRVTHMRGLPLRNHLGNVARLAELWDCGRAFDGDVPPMSPERKAWLVRAAERHDLGKPRRFKIKSPKSSGNDWSKQFTYSFAGHRFDVRDDHPYVQQLIRLHHSFSVSDVTEAQALLQREVTQPHVAAAAGYFPLDLYALEMCDQIEAEATTHAFGAPEERQRVFMEFQVYRGKTPNSGPMRLHLFPYPFRPGEPDEVRLTFESFVVRVPADAEQDGETLRHLLLESAAEQQEPREVVLCPLP